MMFQNTKSLILVISTLVMAPVVQSFTGKATYHTEWASNACDGKPKDGAKFVTALNPDQYGNGLGNHSPVCGHTITVTYNGTSAVVTVIDMGGVGPGGLDLSIAAFEHLAPLSLGFFYPTWEWNDYDPTDASATQDAAGLAAVALGGAAAGTTAAETATSAATSAVTSAVVPPVVSSPVVSGVPAVSTPSASTPVVPAVSTPVTPVVAPVAGATTAVGTAAASVAPVATSAAARPTGGRGGGRGSGRQGRRRIGQS